MKLQIMGEAMFRGLPHNTWDGFIVPSRFWFSRMHNAFPDSGWAFGSSILAGSVSLISGFIGFFMEGWIALSWFLPGVLYALLVAGVKLLLGRTYTGAELSMEHAFNKMSTAKQKEYKTFLLKSYNNNDLAYQAKRLFEAHEDTRQQRLREQEINALTEEIRREINATNEARKIYERSLNEAS